MSDENFLDELLKEAEEIEEQQTEAYFDLILLQIKKLQEQIAYNFEQAEKEVSLINNFTLHKNASLDERIKVLERKLEAFIREKQVKTIELPNGTLKVHKKPDKVEIEDMDSFLKVARPELLSVVPESVKPDLNKIKAFIKHRPVPAGIKVIEGREEFSYKLRKDENDGREEAENGASAQSDSNLRIAG